MRHSKEEEEAFTLIELLVVVAIIGILASIATFSFQDARRQARNARRISDIKTLMTAFQASGNDLPPAPGNFVCVSPSCYKGYSIYPRSVAVDAFLAPALPGKLSDPLDGTRPGGGYLYQNPLTFGSSPAGAYLNYLLEPPASCGPGIVYVPATDYISCLLKLE